MESSINAGRISPGLESELSKRGNWCSDCGHSASRRVWWAFRCVLWRMQSKMAQKLISERKAADFWAIPLFLVAFSGLLLCRHGGATGFLLRVNGPCRCPRDGYRIWVCRLRLFCLSRPIYLNTVSLLRYFPRPYHPPASLKSADATLLPGGLFLPPL
jgi:hypothetical protein